MKKAYIIVVHKNPEQVHRLVQRLNDGTSFFFVHIDKKIDPSSFQDLFDLSDQVKEIENVVSNWGEISLVEAILNGLKAIKNSGIYFDRIILLSGQDYPIKSNTRIDQYLLNSPHRIFIEYFQLPDHNKWQPNGGLYRVNKYFRGLKRTQRYTAKALNFLAMVFPLLQRKLPPDMVPYAGSTWWVIDMPALNYILQYLHHNPDYKAFHKHTFAADEVFFQMLLLNSSDETIKTAITGDNLRFIKWKDIYASHPEIFVKTDLEMLMNSEALFARKFDTVKDAEILDLIDRHCLA